MVTRDRRRASTSASDHQGQAQGDRSRRRSATAQGVPDPQGQARHRARGRLRPRRRAAHGRRRRSRTTSCAIQGEKELPEYLVNEIQEVYRLQGVRINDKHIEVIVRQMLQTGQDRGAGRHRLPRGRAGGQVPRSRRRTSACVAEEAAGRRSQSRCSWASPRRRSRTESFISAASFQETTRVLTEAGDRGQGRPPARASRRTSSWAGSSRPGPASRPSYRKVEQSRGSARGAEHARR
ncbi:MAG: hypothetical protein MZU95_15155 [Desulfomicrobium escambiense]|nr:hypothetical protein [Desulfomicrobium escambiense]